jgi:hypothetical protein
MIRTYRNELIVLLQQYPSNLTVYYKDYNEMTVFYGLFILRAERLYIKQSFHPEENKHPLTVKTFLEILESASTENIEVSLYHESYRGGYNFDQNLILDNIYFR